MSTTLIIAIVVTIILGVCIYCVWERSAGRVDRADAAARDAEAADTAEEADKKYVRDNAEDLIRSWVIAFFEGTRFYQYVNRSRIPQSNKQRINTVITAHVASIPHKTPLQRVWMVIGSIIAIASIYTLIILDISLFSARTNNHAMLTIALTCAFTAIFLLCSLLLHDRIGNLIGRNRRIGTVVVLTVFALALLYMVSLSPARAADTNANELRTAHINIAKAEAKDDVAKGFAAEDLSAVEAKIKIDTTMFGVATILASVGELICTVWLVDLCLCLMTLILRRRSKNVENQLLDISGAAEMETRAFAEDLMQYLEWARVPNYAQLVMQIVQQHKPVNKGVPTSLPSGGDTNDNGDIGDDGTVGENSGNASDDNRGESNGNGDDIGGEGNSYNGGSNGGDGDDDGDDIGHDPGDLT